MNQPELEAALKTAQDEWKRYAELYEDAEAACNENIKKLSALQAQSGALLNWAVTRWTVEVKDRPLVNIHRRALDDTWRQVIRFAGGDPVKLVGPLHDDLVAMVPDFKEIPD